MASVKVKYDDGEGRSGLLATVVLAFMIGVVAGYSLFSYSPRDVEPVVIPVHQAESLPARK